MKAGGDIAAILGLCKSVFAADDAAKVSGKRVLDVSFIKQHTSGFETFEAMVRALDWSLIEQKSDLGASIEGAARDYVEAERVTVFYGMGFYLQVHGFENVALLVNLMSQGKYRPRGDGRPPVRGHSNVQGQRTVGISEKPEDVPLDNSRRSSASSRRARRV